MDSELTIADASSADLWTLDALDGLVLVKVIPEPALSIDVYAGTVCYHYRREWGPDTTRAPIFGLGQPAQFLATFDNYSREDLTVPFRLRVKPTEPTAPIKWTTIQVTVPRCSRQTQRISWLPTHNGTFALEWTAQVGQHDFSGVVRLGVVPPQDPEIQVFSTVISSLYNCT